VCALIKRVYHGASLCVCEHCEFLVAPEHEQSLLVTSLPCLWLIWACGVAGVASGAYQCEATNRRCSRDRSWRKLSTSCF
jgi:hypothetical protein